MDEILSGDDLRSDLTSVFFNICEECLNKTQNNKQHIGERNCECLYLYWRRHVKGYFNGNLSDGASVMMGKMGGVDVKLREQHDPRLVQIHCVAHRLALCTS